MALYRLSPLGVNLDIDPIDVGDEYWTEAGNMVPRPGRMKRALGYTPVFGTPLFSPLFIMYSEQLSQPYWVYAGALNIATIDPAYTHDDITPAELTNNVSENGWSGGNLNGIAILNSIENSAFYWFDGITGGNATVLPGLRANTRYSIMRPFKNHLIGLGVEDSNGQVLDTLHWSDAADPGQVPSTWVPAADNEAGDNVLADEDGNILDGLILRDAFYIYKRTSIYEMVYTGGNNVFSFRKVFKTTGALARNCVVRVKGTHVVLGNGDIYQHDGQNISSIVDGKIKRTFFSTIDSANFENSFAVYLEPQDEVWFCVPTTGNTRPNLALVWNVVTNEFGYRVLPDADFAAVGIVAPQQSADEWDTDAESWDNDTTVWVAGVTQNTQESIVISDAVGDAFFLGNTGASANGVDYQSTVGKLGMDFGEPGREKAIRRIWPRINAAQDQEFTLELFNQRDPMAPIEQVAVRTFKPGRDGVAVNVNARYLGMRLYTLESKEWDIAGVDIDYLVRGEF